MTGLLKNGTIFFNTIDYFQKLEKQIARGDNYEGTTNIRNFNQSDNYKLTLTESETGKKIKINPTKLHLRQFLTDIKGNLFSMYCLKAPDIYDTEFKINEKVKEFGTHVVIIKNVGKFLDLVCEELNKENISYKAKLVDYYDKDKINGDISLFDKSCKYEYQKEYRIVLYRNGITPISIKIGDIRKIAEIFEVDAIDKMKIEKVKITV